MIDPSADLATRQNDDLDRLVARSISARTQPAAAQPRRRVWPWVLTAILAAFVLGMIGSPWFERQVRSELPPSLRSEALSSDPRIEALEARVAVIEAGAQAGALAPVPAADVAPLAARVAALEAQAAALQSIDSSIGGRLEQLAADLQRTSSAVEAGDRQVRELFLIAIARRMMEVGRPLGRLEPAIATRFGAQDAAAVDALAAWSRVPQTRTTLAGRLDTMARDGGLMPAAGNGSWWDRLKARLSSLVVVGPAPVAGDPNSVAAARQALADDDLAGAIESISRAPAGTARDQWLADAGALLAAESALDRLEMAALDTAVATLPADPPAPVDPPVTVGPPAPAQPPVNVAPSGVPAA